jgi:hypothetical protein
MGSWPSSLGPVVGRRTGWRSGGVSRACRWAVGLRVASGVGAGAWGGGKPKPGDAYPAPGYNMTILEIFRNFILSQWTDRQRRLDILLRGRTAVDPTRHHWSPASP